MSQAQSGCSNGVSYHFLASISNQLEEEWQVPLVTCTVKRREVKSTLSICILFDCDLSTTVGWKNLRYNSPLSFLNYPNNPSQAYVVRVGSVKRKGSEKFLYSGPLNKAGI